MTRLLPLIACLTCGMVITLSSLNSAHADSEILRCAYTNNGFGGDEGYEEQIVRTPNGLLAVLSVIDPMGRQEYAKFPVVQSTTRNRQPVYLAKGFKLTLYPELPRTRDGYIKATVSDFTEFNQPQNYKTLCK